MGRRRQHQQRTDVPYACGQSPPPPPSPPRVVSLPSAHKPVRDTFSSARQIGSAHFDVFLVSLILVAIGAPHPIPSLPPRTLRAVTATTGSAPRDGTAATGQCSLRSACLSPRALARTPNRHVCSPNRIALGFGGGGCATLGGSLTMFCGYSMAFLFPERCSLVIGP